MAKRFYLTPRKSIEGSPIWYVRFRDEHGVIGSALSSHETDKGKAETWAIDHLLNGKTSRKPRALTFEEWASPWWRFETCPYIREKIANGFTISPAYAFIRRSYLDRHLIPEFGSIPLTALTPRHFRDLKMKLYQEGKLAPATINRIIGTARIMFNYAVSMEELESNPVAPVKELKETPKARGILSMTELSKLFGPDAFKEAWHGEPRHYALNILAASTGLRMGEIQALQIQYLHPEYVEVKHSWNDQHGLSVPKWGSARLVPIPTRTSQAIASLVALNRWGEPQPTDIVFWGQSRDLPMKKPAILKQFKAAISRIGITEEERARRVVLFHSYRHAFNTYTRGKVPDEQLRRVMGHRSLSMSDNYDHAGAEHLSDVKAAQEKMFSGG